MFAYLIEIYKSMNKELFITTAIFFIFGLIYYYVKIYNQALRHIPDVIRNEEWQQQQNRNEQQFQNNNSEPIEISVQINEERKRFTINLTDNIGNFINTHLRPLNNDTDSSLLFQGRQLNPLMSFSTYPSITNGTVFLCMRRNPNSQENNSDQSNNYPIGTSVSLYTLLTHGMIFLLFIVLIIHYKSYKELFTRSTLIIIQFLGILWAFFFSKTISILFYYKTIVYS